MCRLNLGTHPKDAMEFRHPIASDGYALHQLIADCPPLDPNSMYCNLLQCSHFNETALVAIEKGILCAFITGYIPPKAPTTLFIWQVGVHRDYRGKGLAYQIWQELFKRLAPQHLLEFIETTITDDNKASWALFQKIGREFKCPLEKSIAFDQTTHFKGSHDSEYLVRIPINYKG